MALLNLRAFRDELREIEPLRHERAARTARPGLALEELPKYRTYDGSMNDPAHPDMGRAGMRFGRNTPCDDRPRAAAAS